MKRRVRVAGSCPCACLSAVGPQYGPESGPAPAHYATGAGPPPQPGPAGGTLSRPASAPRIRAGPGSSESRRRDLARPPIIAAVRVCPHRAVAGPAPARPSPAPPLPARPPHRGAAAVARARAGPACRSACKIGGAGGCEIGGREARRSRLFRSLAGPSEGRRHRRARPPPALLGGLASPPNHAAARRAALARAGILRGPDPLVVGREPSRR